MLQIFYWIKERKKEQQKKIHLHQYTISTFSIYKDYSCQHLNYSRINKEIAEADTAFDLAAHRDWNSVVDMNQVVADNQQQAELVDRMVLVEIDHWMVVLLEPSLRLLNKELRNDLKRRKKTKNSNELCLRRLRTAAKIIIIKRIAMTKTIHPK